MNTTDCLLPPNADVLISDLALTETLLVVVATPTATAAACPCCGVESRRIHSHYRRTVADLPFGNRQLALRLVVRRFVCTNAGCSRRIFCERLPQLVEAYARSTKRLQSLQQSLGATAGGEPGARLSHAMAIPISGDTLLRRVRAGPFEAMPPVRCLALDDFAFRKGQNYGTILIDQERGRVIDLLPSRDEADVVAWLKAHPSVEIITRDRSQTYANAATSGAPNAQQIADRWHLLKNLREATERLFNRRHKALPTSPANDVASTPEPQCPEISGDFFLLDEPVRSLTAREEAREGKREQRVEIHRRVHELFAEGQSQRQIAATLDIDRETVARYLRCPTLPEKASHSTSSAGVKYREHVDRRLAEGCRNAAAIHRELIAAGVEASYYAVRRYVRRRLVTSRATSSTKSPSGKSPSRRPSAKQLSFVVIRKPEERDDKEQSWMEMLMKVDEAMRQALELVLTFAAMIRGLCQETLAEWMTKAEASECVELRDFAKTLRLDEAAVSAAMTEPWSNGAAEGHVNRLKTIKRQMYGRASFDLLRARMLRA